MPRTLIFANGILPDAGAARALMDLDDVLIAADGGARHILSLGLTPSAIVGDLDSLTPADRLKMEAAGVRLLQHPQDKNETDLELAIQYALASGADALVVIGALGSRLDQTLGNISLLSDPALAGVDIRLDDGIEEAFFCRSSVTVRGRSGEIVSLLPWGGDVEGVRTEGLKWPLRDETLSPHKTRGISNRMLGDLAEVQISSGLLLLVHRRR
ncbi:MAG: thiamine diphosphokinase [Bacteroidota bacterium]